MSSPPQSSAVTITSVKNEDVSTTPEFIYGGPFIKVQKPEPFIDTTSPINLLLQGTFKQSFAYYSLKERLPIILTKVIDYLSREGGKIKANYGGSDEDVRILIQHISKLKSDLITNKKYDLLRVDTPEAKKWNEWIEAVDIPYYFTNTWVFTECYVYRKIQEGCELTKGLQKFDPFDYQKEQAFNDNLEAMCVVAERLTNMLTESEKDKRKADFITLLKLCLWANKCDLSLSGGEKVSLSGQAAAPTPTPTPAPPPPPQRSKSQLQAAAPEPKPEAPLADPFQMILDMKDKLLVDDTGKAVDQVIAKSEAMKKNIEGPPPPSAAPGSGKGSPPPSPPPPPPPPAPEEGEELPKIPCPAKVTIPQSVYFDIVCDNAGYELFTDLCLAHFLVSQGIAEKVRFHVKSIPWFVSDVTPRDFKFVIDSCAKANYSRTIQPEPQPEPAEGEPPPEPRPPRVVGADPLRRLGDKWAQFVQEGTFILLHDDFWTSPHVYRDMKRYNYNLYRQLQLAIAILFKGDLNYRKLLCEKNVNPITGFEPCLQGFIPAPIIAARTVKAELICGLPKGKFEQLTKADPKWMQSGDYGVIHFCAKAEPLKVSDRPCADYGDTCRGKVCPVHNDL